MREILRVMRRQWLIASVGLLMTIALSVVALRVVPPESSITATVLLLPPVTSDPSQSRPANPYLALGGLTAPAEILSRSMNSPITSEALAQRGARSDYVVTRDMTTSAPVVLVTVTDPNLDRARASRDAILAQIPIVLRQLQEEIGVTEASMISSTVVTNESVVTKVNRSMIRALMLAVALGLGLTVGCSTLTDSLQTLRRSRRDQRSGEALAPGNEGS